MLVLYPTRIYLPFEGNANDASGAGLNGTVYGAQTETAVFGKGYAFDGVDDCISCGNVLNDVFVGTAKFTISFYAKRAAANNDQVTLISKHSESATGGAAYMFRVYSLDNTLRFIWYGALTSASYCLYVVNDFTFNAGTWYHIMVCYDGTLFNSNKVTIYINGVLRSLTFSQVSNPTAIQKGSNASFVVGAYGRTSFNRFWNGSIDQVMVFNQLMCARNARRLMLNLHPIL